MGPAGCEQKAGLQVPSHLCEDEATGPRSSVPCPGTTTLVWSEPPLTPWQGQHPMGRESSKVNGAQVPGQPRPALLTPGLWNQLLSYLRILESRALCATGIGLYTPTHGCKLQLT